MKLSSNSTDNSFFTLKTAGAAGLFLLLGSLAFISESSKEDVRARASLARPSSEEKTTEKEKFLDYNKDLVSLFKNTKKDSFLIAAIQGKVQNTDALTNYLKSSGSKIKDFQITGPYLAIISENGKIIFEKHSAKDDLYENAASLQKELALFKDSKNLSTFTVLSSLNKPISINLHDINYSKSLNGWNILELNSSKSPVASYSADTLNTDQLVKLDFFEEDKIFAAINVNTPNKKIQFRSPPVDIDLQIKKKDLDKIRLKREEAIKRNILFSSKDDLVPAKIVSGETKKKAEIRLKGDWVDHLNGERWSFRVKLKGDNTFLGMKTFSLQDPSTRGYLYTSLFHKAWDKLGGVSLRYKFVNFSINGEKLGTMTLVEHFEKRAVESSQRREGPILKFDESALWKQFDAFGSPYGMTGYTAPLDSFSSKKTLGRENLRKNFIHAANLLDRFRSGKLPAKDVFDIELMANYIALADFFASYHSINWHNMRFYFNPISSRLEPISFDPRGKKIAKRIAYVAHGNTFQAHLFKDNYFTAAYFKALDKLTGSSFFLDLLKTHRSEIEENLSLVRKNKADYLINFKDFKERAKEIQHILTLTDIAAPYYSNFKDGNLALKISVLQPLPIEVTAVSLNGKDFPINSENRFIFPETAHESSYQDFEFKLAGLKEVKEEDNLSLKYKIIGLDRDIKESVIKNYPYKGDDPKEAPLFKQNNYYSELDFIKISEKEKTISFTPGDWELKKPLIIPKGFVFQIFPGTKIKLSKEAIIISSSPIQFIGSEESPIHISGGQGLFLNKVSGKKGLSNMSNIKHVLFSGLSNFTSKATSHTGAVTIFKSPVEIEKCLFQDNNSEDALNIVSSNFTLDKVLFENVDRDALDVDFGKGKVKNSTFLNVGNDALDFSGSKVALENISVHDCTDKGVSSGENSRITGQNIKVNNCQVGIASKDLSKVKLTGVDIHNTKILLTAYAKKPEFGPASISLTNFTHSGDVSKKFLIEKNSSLEIDGKVTEIKRNKNESTILNALKKGVFKG